MLNIEQIARVAHETNRAYCETLADLSQPKWEDAPDWQKNSARDGVHFHVSKLELGETPSPSASHENWMADKTSDGWKYGPVKDPELKQHPCFLPYDELPLEQRLKDYLFASVVAAFWYANQATVIPV